MSVSRASSGQRLADQHYDLDLATDVLVIGGSLAGVWAALAARRAGASVVLAEKGWVGSAGVVAAVGAGGYYIVPGNEDQRRRLLAERHPEAAGLDDLDFLERVYRHAYDSFQRMAAWGYQARSLGGFNADSMFFLRRQAKRTGVRLLDHSPAQELLVDGDGVVTGAAGVQRQADQTWRVRAGAVILATGGTAFLSGAQGTNGSTGDGYLMAAEAGASFIGMEFATSYALAPLESSTTKGGMYFQGHAYDDQGRRLDPEQPAWFCIPQVAEALREGRQPYYVLDKVAPERRIGVQSFAPNFYQNFARTGVDPFQEFWPVTLKLEGSVRASGGIAIDENCATEVPGLYAVGDVADKSRLTGAFLGGAGPCVAWCVVSGEWAAHAATGFARRRASPRDAIVQPLGGAGLRPRGTPSGTAPYREIIRQVQAEMLPLDKGFWRREETLSTSLDALAAIWSGLEQEAIGATGRDVAKTREAAALAATARWIHSAALARRESRGLHRRVDYAAADPGQCHHLRVRGFTDVQVTPQSTAAWRACSSVIRQRTNRGKTIVRKK